MLVGSGVYVGYGVLVSSGAAVALTEGVGAAVLEAAVGDVVAPGVAAELVALVASAVAPVVACACGDAVALALDGVGAPGTGVWLGASVGARVGAPAGMLVGGVSLLAVWPGLAGFAVAAAGWRGGVLARGSAASGFGVAMARGVAGACAAVFDAAVGDAVVRVAPAFGVGEVLAFGGTRVAVGGFGAWVGFGAGVGVSVGIAVGSGVAFRRLVIVWASVGPAVTPVTAVVRVMTRAITAMPMGPRKKEPSMRCDSHLRASASSA